MRKNVRKGRKQNDLGIFSSGDVVNYSQTTVHHHTYVWILYVMEI